MEAREPFERSHVPVGLLLIDDVALARQPVKVAAGHGAAWLEQLEVQEMRAPQRAALRQFADRDDAVRRDSQLRLVSETLDELEIDDAHARRELGRSLRQVADDADRVFAVVVLDV